MPANQSTAPAGGFRADIQALRAVAVLLVVAYHLFPDRVSGGYVGVDVFFVISGFLITSHLVREHERTGRVALGSFYVRRIRRLLPAALVVLLAVVVAYATLMPESSRQQGFREVIASALYVENWVLAFSSVDYLGAAAAPSLVQHYWSLSVEEQFYIVWPLLLVVATVIGRRMSRVQGRRVWLTTLWTVFATSLILSVVVTSASPEWAYFITPARAWEFAVGGLVAVYAATPGHGHAALRAAASWVGLLAIVVSAFVYTAGTPFPGSAALVPVLGAALLIGAGHSRVWWSPMIVGRLRPVQFVGGISYSVYLWHWPAIVLFPIVFGRALGLSGALLVVAVTLLLATASKYWVEEPFLRRGRTARRRWPVLAGTAAVMAVLIVASGIQIGAIDNRLAVAAQNQLEVADGPCYGALALSDADCGDPHAVPADVDTAFAATDYADTTLGDCGAGTTVAPIGDAFECGFGVESSDELVVMVGDSHAGHWLPAVQAIAAEREWRVVTFFRSSCPYTAVTPSESGVFQSACENWKELVDDRISELSPEIVLVASLSPSGYLDAGFEPGSVGDVQSGYVTTLSSLTATGATVAVFKDTPFMGENIPDCLGTAGFGGGPVCDRTRAEALDANPDPLWNAAAEVEGVRMLDLTTAFCDAVTCFAMTGQVVVYRDHHHLSASYARTLAPRLDAELADQLGLAR